MPSSSTAGAHEVADGVFAYLQPPGSWGLSNGGLVHGGQQQLLIDTMFDLAHTDRMLEAFAERAGKLRVSQVVNTHANGDHCWGNQRVPGAEIIASRRSAEEMIELPPSRVALLLRLAKLLAPLGERGQALSRLLRRLRVAKAADLVQAAPFVMEAFGRFALDEVTLVPPNRTFDGTLGLEVGGMKVELIESGPAHTKGDVMAFLPDSRVVFTGDLLFAEAHPVMWEGPVDNWIAALDQIEAFDPAVVVPGHGPLATLSHVRDTKAYWVFLRDRAKAMYDAGVTVGEAVLLMAKEGFSGWSERERIAVNVRTLYREFSQGDAARRALEDLPDDIVALFARMAALSALERTR